ncbi:hypothetical protein K1719_026587 [Acacia pycnantha]|nr:hypothetical protein K1719_026587 [Acacia pycnantha]
MNLILRLLALICLGTTRTGFLTFEVFRSTPKSLLGWLFEREREQIKHITNQIYSFIHPLDSIFSPLSHGYCQNQMLMYICSVGD